MFRNVGTWNSDAGESPKRENTTDRIDKMLGQSLYRYTAMHGQSLYRYTAMHGQSLYRYTAMHGQSLYWYTAMHGQQNIKFIFYSQTPKGNTVCILTYILTPILTPWSRVLLEKLAGFSYSRNSPHCMEPKVSFPHSQVSASCLYPAPAQSSPHPHIPLPEDPS
jgi:hypothetical protein